MKEKKIFAILIVLMAVFAAAPQGSADAPKITITSVPGMGQYWYELQGNVSGVDYQNYMVVPLLYIPGLGWYSKPTCAYPYITLYSNTFSQRIQTGGIDDLAPIIEVYLVPKSSYPACYPTCITGGISVPESLKTAAVSSERVMRPGIRVIHWSGYDWMVKTSLGGYWGLDARVGPGNNCFSASTDNVWIDEAGNLHLKIIQSGSKWVCAEVSSMERLGYGTYKFNCASRVDNIDQNAVLGLFTWSDFSSPNGGNRELDIEFSRWSNPANQNAQFVVQPYNIAGNMQRFDMPAANNSVHKLVWKSDRVSFESSIQGQPQPVFSMKYTNATWIPPSLDERVHINLWLNNGSPPSNGQPVEVVFSGFEFTPYSDRPVYGVSNHAAGDPTASNMSTKVGFKVWGKITSRDCTGFVIDDGSKSPIRVIEHGHTFNVGDFVSAEGRLNTDDPITIDASSGRVTIFKP